jgi:ribulose 1,5-bisphosphate synthetase/thiazole synthase
MTSSPPFPSPWKDATRSFWLETLGDEEKHFASEAHRLSSILFTSPPDEEEEKVLHFDVVIIGGGLTGIATAFWLSKVCPLLSIVILEGRTISGGATGRNGGHLWASSPETTDELLDEWKGFQIIKEAAEWKYER